MHNSTSLVFGTQIQAFLRPFPSLLAALLFSATFRKKIERLARDILVDPIRVVQGDIGEVCVWLCVGNMLVEKCAYLRCPSCFCQQANEDVTQVVELLLSGSDKWSWLTRRLVEFTSSGSVLIFVTKKTNSEELATNLTQEGYSLGLLHGDMDQSERNKVISDFKKNNMPVLVATDVAGEERNHHNAALLQPFSVLSPIFSIFSQLAVWTFRPSALSSTTTLRATSTRTPTGSGELVALGRRVWLTRCSPVRTPPSPVTL